ncbi:MAG: SRPBCC family protein [Nocardioides sp.]
MATFSARTEATAVVPVERARIWDALLDPDLVARLTPFVKQIRAEGDHWIWSLSGINVLGVKFAPTFTERMDLRDQERIEFRHEPPHGSKERAGVHGWYDLSDAGPGETQLVTSLEICVDLPLPRLSGPAVRVAMKGVIATMGERFSKNLLAHLGV